MEMAHEEEHGKTLAEMEARAWELAEKIQFALFSTWNGEKMEQWPLTSTVDKEARAFYFLVDKGAARYNHLDTFPDVMLGFVDSPGAKYVVINGKAELSNDRDKIKELWSPFAKAWWDSAEDPAIRLLTVKPNRAELWDSPNKLVSAALMLTAVVTGTKPAIGDHGAVRL
jgi:general stress protein 26